ncbi:MAG: GNAT family N-acetyltransferase [Erysipelothrix sp.]|jgi:RimJ/RimL family protein N-acetyltransferase|nr:GNAT family N-acetyltransferase [Erysipelothrix sp.]
MEAIQNGISFKLLKDYPQYFSEWSSFIISAWASETTKPLYEDHFKWMMQSDNVIPTWGVLLKDNEVIGCCGLIVNDFNSRMDVWPYLAAVYIDESQRGAGHAKTMINTMVQIGFDLGFKDIYCASDLVEFYESLGFKHIGKTYHPWGENELLVISSLEE